MGAFRLKNYTLYMPLNTAWIRFRAVGDTNGIPDNRLSTINLKVPSLDMLEPALQQARNVLMNTHHGIEDFGFSTQENQLESINKQIHNARMSGGVIAAISLLVGGIGIMNIMLASINERIREIGICKAVGATGLAIFIQVLIESVVIALLGAALGLAGSYAFVEMLENTQPHRKRSRHHSRRHAPRRRLQRGGRHHRRFVPSPQGREASSDSGVAIRVEPPAVPSGAMKRCAHAPRANRCSPFRNQTTVTRRVTERAGAQEDSGKLSLNRALASTMPLAMACRVKPATS